MEGIRPNDSSWTKAIILSQLGHFNMRIGNLSLSKKYSEEAVAYVAQLQHESLPTHVKQASIESLRRVEAIRRLEETPLTCEPVGVEIYVIPGMENDIVSKYLYLRSCDISGYTVTSSHSQITAFLTGKQWMGDVEGPEATQEVFVQFKPVQILSAAKVVTITFVKKNSPSISLTI